MPAVPFDTRATDRDRATVHGKRPCRSFRFRLGVAQPSPEPYSARKDSGRGNQQREPLTSTLCRAPKALGESPKQIVLVSLWHNGIGI